MKKVQYKIVIFLLIFSTILEAKFQAKATQECPAWNNLAHSKNIENLKLQIDRKYTVLEHHKGQYLIKLNYPFKTQRWVDDICLNRVNFSDNNLDKTKKSKNPHNNQNLLLALSWSNYFCKTHPNKKECRPLYNLSKNHLVLHGLWPQPRSRVYCGISNQLKELDYKHRWHNLPKISLSPKDKILEKQYFPGFLSALDRHEWIKHGVCYSNEPKSYFHDGLTLTATIDRSMLGEYLRANIGASVSIYTLRKIFEKSFGKGSGKHIALVCRNGKVSEIRISLRGKGDRLLNLLKDAPMLKSKCYKGFIEGN